jgi:D-alanyl-D-alanine carboxypeptidase (penicillin-binding protein 5/6)
VKSAAGVIAALGALMSAGAALGAPATPPPPVDAAAYVLVDPRSGAVLARKGPDLRLPMASTTKIMTALVVLRRSRLDDVVTVPAEAAAVGESSAGLVPGEELTVRDLLTGLMVGSGNDAAVALADHVAGSQAAFADLMNQEAARLGMTRTRFQNPHGLDAPGHYSTVRDMVRMGRALMRYPFAREVVASRTATIPGPGGAGVRSLESRNALLELLPEADGIKTGNTSGAGYALVAHADRPATGADLYAAIIGSPSEADRAADAAALLRWGLAQYARPTLLARGAAVVRAEVRDRPGVEVTLRVARPLAAPIRLGEPIRQTVVAPAEVVAPVRAGQRLGQVVVRQGGRVLGRRDLVAASDVGAPTFTDRLRTGWGNLI